MIIVSTAGVAVVVEVVVPIPPAGINMYNARYGWREGYLAGFEAARRQYQRH